MACRFVCLLLRCRTEFLSDIFFFPCNDIFFVYFKNTYFYNALWDLTRYLERHPFKNGEKATMIVFGDAEKMDDSPDDWYEVDKAAWEKKLEHACAEQNDDPLARQRRIPSSTTEKDALRQTSTKVCGLMGALSKNIERIIFFHTSDKEKNLHCGENKSQFMFTRLFDTHLHSDCELQQDTNFKLHFPAQNSSLADLEVNYPIHT